ncbi:MAG: autotransporter domain-containing protein [Usitatibacter sp.]
MKTQKRVLPALLLSLFAATAAPSAAAAQFSNIYVFGDSLSDAGYFRGFLLGAGVPAPLAAQMGRYTTNPGPIWAELVASYYGLSATPSNVGSGNDFAQGGARVTEVPGVSTPPGQAQRPVATQITEYLARTSNVADPNALYTVWAGANDLFYNLGVLQAGGISQAQLQTNVLGAATAEIGQIARLKAAGARYIAVFTLPNIGATPAFAGNPLAGAITQLSAGYNTTLFTGLQGAGIKVIPVDAFSLFNQILAAPGAYGFTNTTGIACGAFPPVTTAATANSLFCYTGNLVTPGANQTYIFADSVHPTSAAHAIVAQFTESLIEGPTQYGLLAESALRTRASHVRAVGDGLAKGRQEEMGKLGVFVGGDGSDFKIESGTGNTGIDSRLRSGVIGLTMRASEAVTIGASYGYSRNKSGFGSAGSYDTGENAWSLFGNVTMGGFYGTGVVTFADIRFSDIRRNIQLGPVLTTATAKSEGSNASAYFSAGYDFHMGRVAIGPTVAVTTQSVDVNQFDETGGGAAGLRIQAQKRKSEVWSVGARASVALGSWTPWIRITADKERRDDVRFVSATPLSMLAINSTYDIPAYQPDTSYTTGSIGVNGSITPNVAVGIAYTRISGRSGIKEDGISGVVSVRF